MSDLRRGDRCAQMRGKKCCVPGATNVAVAVAPDATGGHEAIPSPRQWVRIPAMTPRGQLRNKAKEATIKGVS